MSGAKHRKKGDRIEREIVARHIALGVHAERYPLSGASRFRGEGHDTDLYVFGRDKPPLKAEVKSRANGAGFTLVEKWIEESDVLFVRRDNADPLVVQQWAGYALFLKCLEEQQAEIKRLQTHIKLLETSLKSSVSVLRMQHIPNDDEEVD